MRSGDSRYNTKGVFFMAKITLRQYEDGSWSASAMTMTKTGWRQLHWKVVVDDEGQVGDPQAAGAAVQGLFEQKKKVQDGTSVLGDMQ
jgi:hypothetical protein